MEFPETKIHSQFQLVTTPSKKLAADVKFHAPGCPFLYEEEFMSSLTVVLFEWPQEGQPGGPRLIGRSSDSGLATVVLDHLRAERERGVSEPGVETLTNQT